MNTEYIHGFTPQEQNRLSQLQAIINNSQIHDMDLDGVRRVLDVGSGLGQFAYRLANELDIDDAGRPTVVGIEKDPRQLEQCRFLNLDSAKSVEVDFRLGDAAELPLNEDEWGTFDLVHCRFVLEHSPLPQVIVEQMAQAVRPGGQVYILDDDHELLRLSPDCPPLSDLWKKYWKSYEILECDPLIGRRVPQLCGNAGLEVVDVSTLFFGATRGEPTFELVVDNLIRVVDSARTLMISHGMATETDFHQAEAESGSWRKQSNATVWYSLPVTRATKRIEG